MKCKCGQKMKPAKRNKRYFWKCPVCGLEKKPEEKPLTSNTIK